MDRKRSNRLPRLAEFRRFQNKKNRLVDRNGKAENENKAETDWKRKTYGSTENVRKNRLGKKLDLSSKFHFFTLDTMILENSIFWQSVVFAIWGYLFAIFLNTLVGVPRRLIESA